MAAIDYREAIRFVLTGAGSTLGNVAMVALTRDSLGFHTALLLGIGVGMTLSFVLSKLFAFRSPSAGAAPGEALRFLIVYGCGLVIYYGSAVYGRVMLLHAGVPGALADLVAVLVGASFMVVTGYFGHRFFTYRTHARSPT
jgi:putative flippase GtrA